MELVYDPAVRKCAQYLLGNILGDPNQCTLLEREVIIEIPEALRARVPPEDLYLVEAYHTVQADVLVTTDMNHFRPLMDELRVRERDEFLREYLQR